MRSRNNAPRQFITGANGGCAIAHFHSLSAAGFAATAISYGPARMGFGLFVPEFREAFSMSTTQVGLVSSLGFLGMFVGLVAAQLLLTRRGPGAPVSLGLGAAMAGLGVVAAAQNVGTLAAGVFLAAVSAGFAWTPFNDAVHRKICEVDRPTALSGISTGTSMGIAGAGMAALAVVMTDLSWRECWAAFAIAGAMALVANRAALVHVEKDCSGTPRHAWRRLLYGPAVPLFAIAFVYGIVSAVYISFAADHMLASGGVPGVPRAATPGLVFLVYGLFGLAGLLTGQVRRAIGLTWLLRLLMLAGALSLALIAVVPARWSGLVASAGLQGVHVMMTSAVLAFWSERLFPTMPSLGFTAALLATATGSILGPAVSGLVSDSFGAGTMFLATAALPAVTAAALRGGRVRERAAAGPAMQPA